MQDLHDHSFGQDQVKPGERRTLIVVVITAIAMVMEITAGMAFGSMALLADGLHMASHAAALMISVFAYGFARRHAHDRRFTFGTGKVNALAGFAGAILLISFAVIMASESLHRILKPTDIELKFAIIVAVIGLAVNAICALILSGAGPHKAHGHGHDHNLRSAYLHVIADALTSVLAIIALLAALLRGWMILDPLMGIVGAVLVARWSVGLIRDTSGILLDCQAPDTITDAARTAVESIESTHVLDLHIWSIGPGIYSGALVVTTDDHVTPAQIREQIPEALGLVHMTIEITHA